MTIPGVGAQPTYWQGIMIDITEQRAQDQALHELTASLRGVFLASPLAIVVFEPDGRVRHWNPAAERIFGWSAEEVVGAPVPYVPEDKAEEFAGIRTDTIAGHPLTGLETVRLRKDGSRVAVSISTAPLVGADGAVTGMLAVVDDITERRRVADELARRQRQQEAVADLGVVALEGPDQQVLLDEASRLVAERLGVQISGVFELLPDEQTLVLRSGVGWGPGLVGSYTIGRHDPSIAGYALQAGEPVTVGAVGSERPVRLRAEPRRSGGRQRRGDRGHRGQASVRRPRGARDGGVRVHDGGHPLPPGGRGDRRAVDRAGASRRPPSGRRRRTIGTWSRTVPRSCTCTAPTDPRPP